MKFFNLKQVPSTSSTKSEFYYDRLPDVASGWKKFRDYLWNTDDHTACNRTCKSWYLFVTMYGLFLMLCFGLFFLMLFATTASIDHITHGSLYRPKDVKNPLH